MARPGGGGGNNTLVDDTDVNCEAEGCRTVVSRISTCSLFLLKPDAVGSYTGGSSLSWGAYIGSPESRAGPLGAGPFEPTDVVP